MFSLKNNASRKFLGLFVFVSIIFSLIYAMDFIFNISIFSTMFNILKNTFTFINRTIFFLSLLLVCILLMKVVFFFMRAGGEVFGENFAGMGIFALFPLAMIFGPFLIMLYFLVIIIVNAPAVLITGSFDYVAFGIPTALINLMNAL